MDRAATETARLLATLGGDKREYFDHEDDTMTHKRIKRSAPHSPPASRPPAPAESALGVPEIRLRIAAFLSVRERAQTTLVLNRTWRHDHDAAFWKSWGLELAQSL